MNPLFEWLREKFSQGATVTNLGASGGENNEKNVADIYFRELAVRSGISLIAGLLSKCEFRTFADGNETRGDEWHKWNMSPNSNQNANEFKHEIVSRMYTRGEAVVVPYRAPLQTGEQFFIADSYSVEEKGFAEDRYRDIIVRDERIKRDLRSSELLVFRLPNAYAVEMINGIFNAYQSILEYTMRSYKKSRGVRGVFSYDTIPAAGEAKKSFDKLIDTDIKKWLNSDGGALPLGKGQKWDELGSKLYSNDTTRDIRAMVDDISDFISRLLGIPPALMRGNVEGIKDAMELFLTGCLKPLASVVETEITRKRFSISPNNYLRVDTRNIKHVDVLDAAPQIDKLIASAVYSVNDARRLLGDEIIPEPWADKHVRTKNYEPVDAVPEAKGGE